MKEISKHMNKQQVIVAVVRNEYELAADAYRKAHSEYTGLVASANAWDNYKRNITTAEDKYISARDRAYKLCEAYNFVVDTFLNESDN